MDLKHLETHCRWSRCSVVLRHAKSTWNVRISAFLRKAGTLVSTELGWTENFTTAWCLWPDSWSGLDEGVSEQTCNATINEKGPCWAMMHSIWNSVKTCCACFICQVLQGTSKVLSCVRFCLLGGSRVDFVVQKRSKFQTPAMKILLAFSLLLASGTKSRGKQLTKGLCPVWSVSPEAQPVNCHETQRQAWNNLASFATCKRWEVSELKWIWMGLLVPYTENWRFMEPPCFLEELKIYTAFTGANS